MARFIAGFRRIVRHLWSALTMVLLLVSCSVGAAFAQPAVPPTASPGQLLPTGDASQLPQPQWRAVFPYRSAFGSLCPLAPLACALIDRPFAFSARLELFLRPNASDGSTSLLLPFAASVPLFGRAELGLGSCYVGFWNPNQEANKTAVDPSAYRMSGLCPLWLAGKILLFPWFRDPHTHPALSVEYQGEYQAGPFNGLNQLGLPGPLSKVSLAYRHPLSRLEVAGAAGVLVDHTTRAGTVQLGGHVGYRLPVGEHFWIFGQTLAQLPFFGSAIEERQARQLPSLAPPVAGTLVVGAQQRADFGFGVGLSLMLTKSEQETRVDVLVRLLSFEIGPHIKALFPARPKVDEPPKVEARVVPPPTVPSLCSPAHPPTPDCVPAPLPKAVYERLPGSPCFLYSPDGSEQLEMGHIDSTSHFCDWDGLHLPLGAVIPPGTPEALPSSQRPGPLPSPAPHRETRHQPLAHRVVGNKLTKPIVVPPAAQRSGTTAPLPAVAVDAGTRLSPCAPPPSLWRRGMSPVTQGFADGAVEACQHAEQIYKVIKEHGPLVVLPRRQDMVDWWQQTKQECLDRLGPCIREKAQEARAELDRFRRLSWEQQQYELGKVGFQVVEQTVINAVLPGGAAATSTGVKAAEHAAEEQLAKAAKRKLEKEAAERAAEAAAKKAAQEAAAAEAKRVAGEEAKRVAEAEAKRVAEAEAKRTAEEKAAGSGRKRGIYEFPDQAAGGKPYVGQSGNISQRLKQHEQSGRLTPGTETTHAVDGGKTAREVAEHQRIQEITGGVPARQSPDVANKVDPIGPNRRHWLEKK